MLGSLIGFRKARRFAIDARQIPAGPIPALWGHIGRVSFFWRGFARFHAVVSSAFWARGVLWAPSRGRVRLRRAVARATSLPVGNELVFTCCFMFSARRFPTLSAMQHSPRARVAHVTRARPPASVNDAFSAHANMAAFSGGRCRMPRERAEFCVAHHIRMVPESSECAWTFGRLAARAVWRLAGHSRRHGFLAVRAANIPSAPRGQARRGTAPAGKRSGGFRACNGARGAASR